MLRSCARTSPLLRQFCTKMVVTSNGDVLVAGNSPAKSGPGSPAPQNDLEHQLTPHQVVEQLDKYIVGQLDAKKAIAIALRDRWRRRCLPENYQREVQPSTILMKGPTGCGKTELARRLAAIADAPFTKVEATKFTEVGIVGTDADSMIKTLTTNAFTLETKKARARVEERASELTLEVLVNALRESQGKAESEIAAAIRSGKLDEELVTVSVDKPRQGGTLGVIGGIDLAEFQSQLMGMLDENKGVPDKVKRTLSVAEARVALQNNFEEELARDEPIAERAVEAAEETGIVFIDEIDKLGNDEEVGRWRKGEGVQKELLSVLEGTVVTTAHGPVRTDHILFVCAGAFHGSKPSDLMPELQGRLPVRVELTPLKKDDFMHILAKVEFNILQQQVELLRTEGVELEFTDEAVDEIATVAELVNNNVENIGARRLRTIISKVMDDLKYNAHLLKDTKQVVDRGYVAERVRDLTEHMDLAKFII